MKHFYYLFTTFRPESGRDPVQGPSYQRLKNAKANAIHWLKSSPDVLAVRVAKRRPASEGAGDPILYTYTRGT